MELSFSRRSLIRVLCESCRRVKDNDCLICEGTGSYYWDPTTLVCFTQGGKLIQTRSRNGQIIDIEPDIFPEDRSLEISEMLDYIDLWVKEDSIRKWKLWIDHKGWHSSLGFDRFKKEGANCSNSSYEDCVIWAYERILKYST